MTAASEPALFRRYPRLAERIPWLSLGRFPTPVQRLPLEGAAEVWCKRDDLSGEAYGGNKVRKLEFVLAEARRRGAGRLITAGAAGSHHALATTVYGTRLGFDVTLVLCPQPPAPHVRAALLQDAALGATLRCVPRMEMIPLGIARERAIHRRERPYVIAPGGSDAYGTLGYVSAALELAEQVEAGEAPLPRVVHVAAGTMGTAAGLAIGFAMAGLPVRVEAARITTPLLTNRWMLGRLMRATARLLEDGGAGPVPLARARAGVRLHGAQIGRGYGHRTAAGDRAVDALSACGLALDPTYTAKSAAGLLEALREAEGPVLFWHTLSACEAVPPDHLPSVDVLPPRARRWVRRTIAPVAGD
jgi:D-cysteine desulfhydrase